ncbi:aurora kinase A activator-like protein bora [Nomia melanderi]|uniref:aurora kinase A activator-like protein bora n=1 Tax=Nomia melanderi TaxID=2448451 RepID=UPI003FCC722D
MEQLKWTTPIKNERKHDNITIKSPIVYKTPVKQYETVTKHTTYQNNISCFSVLPKHITPPSGLTKFMARNPFETDLTNRLHLSVISPSVFSKVQSPSEQSPDFAWSVDELAMMQPARIEEYPMQQIHCIDPETEVKAQAAIDQFFKENQIIPSPWEMKKKDSRIKTKTDTPTRASSDMNTTSFKVKKDGWSQTVLSLPPNLPPDVAEALKPYFTFTQEQNSDSDDANSSNNSLRRKLFFNNDECAENEEESSEYLSPVGMNGSFILSSSHPQSGMLVDGVPLKDSDNHLHTSEIILSNLSPPNISPIHKARNNMSCESVRSRNRSVARLDFTTEMSVDETNVNDKENTNNHSLDASLDKVKALDNNSTYIETNHLTEANIAIMNSTNLEKNFETEILEFISKDQNDVHMFNHLTNSCKMFTSENCILQQTNAMLGMSDQHSVSNSVQDTGYQTYSMSSTVNVTDSYNITPVKPKTGYSHLLADDEFRLSDWKENMKNIFSSTPSRSNRERENHIF